MVFISFEKTRWDDENSEVAAWLFGHLRSVLPQFQWKRVQLVHISTTFHVWVDEWGLYRTSIHRIYKPTYNWGHHLVHLDVFLWGPVLIHIPAPWSIHGICRAVILPECSMFFFGFSHVVGRSVVMSSLETCGVDIDISISYNKAISLQFYDNKLSYIYIPILSQTDAWGSWPICMEWFFIGYSWDMKITISVTYPHKKKKDSNMNIPFQHDSKIYI